MIMKYRVCLEAMKVWEQVNEMEWNSSSLCVFDITNGTTASDWLY